jgi:hypothetical protein
MIDWLSVEVPDSIGRPVNAGHVLKLSAAGNVEWSTAARLPVEGSWSSNMMFRCPGAEATDAKRDEHSPHHHSFTRLKSGLEISGNPAKFLMGHNLFGCADAISLLGRVVKKAAPAIWPGEQFNLAQFDLGEAPISRIDLTDSWVVDRPSEVLPFLGAMGERVFCPYRGRGVLDGGGSTLYYGRTDKGKRAKDWTLKLYSKGHEIGVHPLPLPAYTVPGLLDDVNRTIRVELTLRTAELKRIGLTTVGDWTPDVCRAVWEAYVAKLDFGEDTLNLDTLDLAELGLKPRHVAFLGAWKAGNDLRSCMSKTAFYRLRNELKDLTGYDIALRCPKSNVVPLQRVIRAGLAGRPVWADALTDALSNVA